jgi:hypothetical protein
MHVNLSEGDPDLFDAAGPLGANFAAAHMKTHLDSSQKDYQASFTYAPLEEVA